MPFYLLSLHYSGVSVPSSSLIFLVPARRTISPPDCYDLMKNEDSCPSQLELTTCRLDSSSTGLDNKKTPAKVFKLLKLNNAGDTLLDNPQIGGWLKYVADFNEKNPTKAEKSIVLLTNHYGDEALSKVLLEAKQIPSTASIADRLHGEQIQCWLATKEAPRYVFKFLTLDKAGDKLLENPQLTAWLKYVDDFNSENKLVARVAVMAHYYGDEALTKLLFDAMKTPSTASMASTFHEEQIVRWLSTRKAPGDVFKFLALNRAGENLFENPQLTTWLKYVDDFNANNTPISRISVMTSYYGDEALTKMLFKAMETPSTANMAGKFHDEQFQHWLDTQTHPGEVFKALVLDKAGDKLLQNPRFATWIKYVDDLNSNNLSISKYAVMAHYYDDETLTKMLFEAMKAPSTANNAAKLHKEQIQYWLDTRKPPGDVFQLLSLDKAGEKLFDHPQFMKWVKYVEDLNKVHPDKKTTLISVLTKHYDSEALAKMMESAKDVPQSAKLVKLLETEQKWMTKETPDNLFKRLKLDQMENHVLSNTQLKTWIGVQCEMLDEAAKAKDTAGDAKILKNELLQSWMQKGWSPEYIFDVVLRLDQDGNKLFRNPLVTTWGKYLIAFNRDNYGKETTIWMMLAASRIDLNNLKPVAGNVPEQFFAMMGLADKGHNLLASPEFVKWIQYLDDFYEEFPDLRKTMMATLRKHYDDKSLVNMIASASKVSKTKDIAKSVEFELFKNWYGVSYKSADQIFTILNLDRAGSSLFTGPWLDTWIRYMIMFEEWYFHNHMAKTLLKYYDENDLSQMVKMAKSNPNTEKLASYIENALLRFNNLPKSD
ncbi:hypothetical protein F444_13331 [Phytophthora nicotianae P1976]|uniref:RxLR effector PexRD54 WY domain-containing protein n=1 Tax=Phytophthora nicotianae P1976 TaxID=1317066 RepID=A0A080ZU52_PHYNI|nr:hypothetical protein F444_13331 [Phytophthora nicotianae P1976]